MTRNELQSGIAEQVKKLNWLRQNPEIHPSQLESLLLELKELNSRLVEDPSDTGKP